MSPQSNRQRESTDVGAAAFNPDVVPADAIIIGERVEEPLQFVEDLWMRILDSNDESRPCF